ncbi:MAG: DUF4124 domain-containing protein [Gammaproteobacteria bacterium]|nr:DUF4124 domain-containing protein [Gammaproteobacteria bacterium]
MKLLFKMLLPLLIIGGGYAYLLGGGAMGGFDLKSFLQPKEDRSKGIEGLGNAVTDKNVTVYQWVDEHGQKHFSSTPPVGQAQVDTVKLSPDANVVKAIRVPEEEEEAKRGSQVTSVRKNPYSPEGVRDLMQDTKDVSNMMNERAAEQQKILDSLMQQSKP